MRILITGGSGFLGVPTAKALLARGHAVTSLDTQISADLELDGITQHRVSIENKDALGTCFAEARPDVVIHAAAIVGVTASANAVSSSVAVNVIGSVNVFEAALEAGVSRLIDISSEETYGDFVSAPLQETDHALPISPYGITKFAVERLGDYYAQTRGLNYHALRYSWIYGPKFPRARIPQKWIDDALAGRTSHESHGSEQRIDFTYVDDAVEGLVAAAEAPELAFRAYHIASGQSHLLTDVATILKRECPEWDLEIGDGLLEFAPGLRAARKGAMSISRAQRDLRYQPTTSLEDGIRKTLEWSRARDAAGVASNH